VSAAKLMKTKIKNLNLALVSLKYSHLNNVKKIWQGVSDISLKSSKSQKPISLKINGAATSNPVDVLTHTFLRLLIQLGHRYLLLQNSES